MVSTKHFSSPKMLTKLAPKTLNVSELNIHLFWFIKTPTELRVEQIRVYMSQCRWNLVVILQQ